MRTGCTPIRLIALLWYKEKPEQEHDLRTQQMDAKLNGSARESIRDSLFHPVDRSVVEIHPGESKEKRRKTKGSPKAGRKIAWSFFEAPGRSYHPSFPSAWRKLKENAVFCSMNNERRTDHLWRLGERSKFHWTVGENKLSFLTTQITSWVSISNWRKRLQPCTSSLESCCRR